MRKFIFTEERLHHLRAVKAQGGSLAKAAEEMGVNVGTLSLAIRSSEFQDEVFEMYPQMLRCRDVGGKPKREAEMQRITLEELHAEPPVVDTSLPHVRAAMMQWRGAA